MRPGPFLKPETQSWPVGDIQHAKLARTYMRRGFGKRSEYPMLREKLHQYWPQLALPNNGMQGGGSVQPGIYVVVDREDGSQYAGRACIRRENGIDWKLSLYAALVALRDEVQKSQSRPVFVVWAVTEDGTHKDLTAHQAVQDFVASKARPNRSRARRNRGEIYLNTALIERNKREVDKLLSTAPSTWREQFRIGLRSLNAAGEHVQGPLTRENALKILGITAGGNLSGERVYGGIPVPDRVRDEAMHGLRLSHRHNYGAYEFIGLARAIQLATEPCVSRDSVSRIHAYLGRHEADKRAAGFGSEVHPSRGYMAWLNWGGDEAKNWTKVVLRK